VVGDQSAQPLIALILIETAVPEDIGLQRWQSQRWLYILQIERTDCAFGQFVRHRHQQIGGADDVGHSGEVGHAKVDVGPHAGFFQNLIDAVIRTFQRGHYQMLRRQKFLERDFAAAGCQRVPRRNMLT